MAWFSKTLLHTRAVDVNVYFEILRGNSHKLCDASVTEAIVSSCDGILSGWANPIMTSKMSPTSEYTWLHSPVFHSTGQSIILQNCWALGGGWGHKSAPTGSVFPPPRATSWMQWTSRVWTPPPQVRVQVEKSLVFHLGGQGMSLHVRVIESGRPPRSIGHKWGLTRCPSDSRTHSMMDSWTPI